MNLFVLIMWLRGLDVVCLNFMFLMWFVLCMCIGWWWKCRWMCCDVFDCGCCVYLVRVCMMMCCWENCFSICLVWVLRVSFVGLMIIFMLCCLFSLCSLSVENCMLVGLWWVNRCMLCM